MQVTTSSNQSGLRFLIAVTLRPRNIALMAVWAVLAGAAALGVSYLFVPRYAATVLVVPANAGGPASGLARLASDLGELSGVSNLSGLGGGDQALARELLESRAILNDLIDRHQLMRVIFADDWDPEAGQWRLGIRGGPPTIGDAIDEMDRNVRRIVVDRQTGAMRVTMTWRDPEAAATWANSLIELVNARARDQAIREAETSVALLTTEANATDRVELRTAIFGLIGSQIRAMTIARSRENFALRVIDPAVQADADDYVFPNRVLMAVTSAAFAVFIVLFVALLRDDSHTHSLRNSQLG